MSEYIERGALIAAYDAAHKGPPGGARKLMEEAPAVDVVPVVRCKDCVHCTWLEEYPGSFYPFCTRDWCHQKEDDFCSHGERKDGADNG